MKVEKGNLEIGKTVMNLGMEIECGNIIYFDTKMSYFVEKFIIMVLQ